MEVSMRRKEFVEKKSANIQGEATVEGMGKKISVSSLNGYRTFSQSRENPGQGKSSSKNPGTSVLVFVGEEADPLICARSAYPLLSLFLKFFLTQLTQTISSSSRSVVVSLVFQSGLYHIKLRRPEAKRIYLRREKESFANSLPLTTGVQKRKIRL